MEMCSYAHCNKNGGDLMVETVLAIIGVCLGFGLAGIFLLAGMAVVLLFAIRELVQLVKWIWGADKDKKRKEDDK